MPGDSTTPAILSVQNVVRSYGAQPVLDAVSLTVHEGDRIGLIGRNGSGKSTLLRILAGLDAPDAGLVTRRQGLRVALLAQECRLARDKTVQETLEAACGERMRLLEQYHQVMHALAGAPDEPRRLELERESIRLHHALDHADGWDIAVDIKKVAIALRLPDGERRLDSLSGGELRRMDLAGRLLERPDLLLLDEPTNHIDTRSVEWIESFLSGYKGSCVLVTHDRYFLDRIVNRIVEIEFSGLYSFPGRYARFLEYKAGIEETRERTEENRRALLRRELEWLQRGPKARSTKQKARITRYEEVEGQGPPPKHREFDFAIPEPERLAKTILIARNIFYGYEAGDLFRDLTLIMQKGMRVGILGENGCGKTTLLRVLMGLERPRKGQVIVGETTRFLYVDQAHEAIQPDKTVLEFVSDGQRFWDVGTRRIYVPNYLESFLFDARSVQAPMGTLSGGERNRLDLARKLLRGGNFLVLDEPTNDLDLYTLRVLEEAILNLEGCALIVSHDRFFLNRVCTHLIVFEGEGRVVTITGNYDDYVLYRERMDAEKPTAPAAKAPEPVKPRSDNRQKLTYQEKRELEGMEETILAAEEAVQRLEQAVQAPGFYEQPHEAVRAALAALEEGRVQVEQLYARWEDLENRKG